MKNSKDYLNAFKSVLASFLGVQSYKNYEKDAQTKSFFPFILMAIIMTLLFVVGIYLVVNFVIL